MDKHDETTLMALSILGPFLVAVLKQALGAGLMPLIVIGLNSQGDMGLFMHEAMAPRDEDERRQLAEILRHLAQNIEDGKGSTITKPEQDPAGFWANLDHEIVV